MSLCLSRRKPGFYGWAYVLLIVFYFFLYVFFHDILGLSESCVDNAYLSLVTITTLGFGDVVPMSDSGKILVSSQAFFGVMTLGLFLNSLSHERSKALSDAEEEIESLRKEELRKSLEMHSCLLLDVFKSANPFAWDKHAKFSSPMDDLEDFCHAAYRAIGSGKRTISPFQVKMLLETVCQNYDTLLSLTPVAAEISSEHLLEWSSLLSNARNLKQQYEESLGEDGEIREGEWWPSNEDVALQVKELIQVSLFLSGREKVQSGKGMQ